MRYFIYIIIFLSFFDLFTQLPIMSTYAESLGASAFLTGLAVGMYSFSNTFGNILSGVWTDRSGPYRVLIVGLFATGISLLLYSVVKSPMVLLVVRFIHGLVGGFIVPAAFTFLSNLMKKEKRGQSSAISGALIGIAAISGPAFSGILANKLTVPIIFSITGTCLLLLGFISLVVLKHFSNNNVEKEETHHVSLQLFQNIGLLKSYAGAFFLMFAQGVIAYLLPLKVQELGFGTHITGTLLSTFGIVAVLLFLLPTNRVFDLVSPDYTLAFGISLMGTSLLLLSSVEDMLFLYVSMAFYGVGFAFLFPSINSLLIDSTTKKERGKAYGYFYAFFSIGTVGGSSLLGWLDLGIQQGFIFTGIILILFALLSMVLKRKSLYH